VLPVPPVGAHAYVYGGVPPPSIIVAEPLHAPLQFTFTCEVVIVNAGGCVMLKVCVIEQPAGELIVQVYEPAHNPLAVAPVPPVGSQAYV
jgi:hypothetical protein